MKNSIIKYVSKKSSKIYIRYRINGKIKDEQLNNLEYFSKPNTVKEINTNKNSPTPPLKKEIVR